MMEIIEEFLISKTGKYSDCEDKIYKSNNFIAVIDGATSKIKKKNDLKTTGLMASEVIFSAIEEIPLHATAISATNILTEKINEHYIKNNIIEKVKKNPEYQLGASIVIYSHYKNEIWFIGDCQARVNNKLITNKKKIDKILSSVRSLFIDLELIKKTSINQLIQNDTAREYIFPLLLSQYKLQNNENSHYNYSCLNGFPINKKNIKIYKLRNKNYKIVLASDGYPKLKKSLIKSEKKLASILKKDPLLYKKYKSTKGLVGGNISFDDRAYIKFKVKKSLSIKA